MISSINFFGLGKLGLPLAATFASVGVRVNAIDIDADHVRRLDSGAYDFSEPGLNELLRQARPNMSFHRQAGADDVDAAIILVPTPSDPDNPSYSISFVVAAVAAACEAAARSPATGKPFLVIVSSTVMLGALEQSVRPILADWAGRSGRRFDLAYVPDLVALGNVVRGFRAPPALVLAADDDAVRARTRELYDRIVDATVPRVEVGIAEAELIKIAWNFYFCVKVSFGNMLARVADRTGAIDVDKVTSALAKDPRIGKSFMTAGMPFGGPCLPRDVDAMMALVTATGEDATFISAVHASNAAHLDYIVDAVAAANPRHVGLLGVTFKAGTTVTIQSPAFWVIQALVARGIAVTAYDPSPAARAALAQESWASGIVLTDDLAGLCSSADVLVVGVDDPLYAGIGLRVPATSSIVDPWGRVAVGHPGLRRIGRRPA